MDTFFVTDVDRTPLAVAYMGTLRKDSEQVFNSIQKRLQATEGKAHRKPGPIHCRTVCAQVRNPST